MKRREQLHERRDRGEPVDDELRDVLSRYERVDAEIDAVIRHRLVEPTAE